MRTYSCPWCGQVFTTMPSGGCPKCGGPGVKEDVTYIPQASPSSQSNRVDQVDFPTNSPRSYLPTAPNPIKRAQYSFFSTFGFKVGLMILSIPVLFFLGITTYWFFYTGDPTPDSDPALRNTYPTQMVTPTTRPPDNPFQDFEWLSVEDAIELRQKENVVNFAHLSNGNTQYSARYSVDFEPSSWQSFARPAGFNHLVVTGTKVDLEINGKKYVLNVLQPFAAAGNYKIIYLVDSSGTLWIKQYKDVQFEEIEDVVDSLILQVLPNPELSITH